MDKPADPATPLREVYQHFLTILEKHGRKLSTRVKYLYDYGRFHGTVDTSSTSERLPVRLRDSAAGSLPGSSGHDPDLLPIQRFPRPTFAATSAVLLESVFDVLG